MMTMKKKKRSGEGIVERGRSSYCACVMYLFFIMKPVFWESSRFASSVLPSHSKIFLLVFCSVKPNPNR